MRISKAVVSITLAAGAGLVGLPAVAHAQGINPPPPRPVAERPGPPRAPGVVPGWQASGGAGTGFAGTYAFGVEGRVGYSFPIGLYLGGDVQGYWGNSVGGNQAHATFFGGEVGYEYYPVNGPLELRPYVFLGPAFVTQVSSSGADSHTGLGFQPGVLGTYHFGQGFAGADFRLMATPGPFSAALMATGGLGF